MRIGIIGGHGHFTLRNLPGADFAWAEDGEESRAGVQAGVFGSSNIFPDPEQMFASFSPELCYLGSTYARNGHLAAWVLERGIPVVTEKPMAADFATLGRIARLTTSGPGIVAEHTMRWLPAFLKAREIIRAGSIGEPVLVQAQKSYKLGRRPAFYRERSQFGGIIPWVAIHAIDFAFWCTGLRYQSVTAAHGNRCSKAYPEMEDFAAMTFSMEGGVPCLITADFLRPAGASSHGDDRLRVTGTEGVVEVRGAELFLITGHGEERMLLEPPDAIWEQAAQDLVDAALRRTGSVMTPEECLHVTSAALAAREAADTKQPQAIDGQLP
ncbi:MAG: Gfo/Idh/MocA family protein [Terrimicrobiaceae bacterium]